MEDFPGGEASCLKSMCHSPTAIALGSSAIVKVSGRNCFRTLYGSLGQIRLGLPKGSAEGSTKVPPSFHCGSSKGAARIHQGPSSFVVSVVLWSKSVVRSYKVPWKVHQGLTEVPPRLRKFCDLSSRADPFWGAKRFCGRFPHHFFELVSQLLNSFLHFSRTASALETLECSAIVKVLGQNDAFVLLASLRQIAKSPPKRFVGVFPKEFPKDWSNTVSCGSFGQMAVASEKVVWRVPPTVLYICLPVSSWGQRFVNC